MTPMGPFETAQEARDAAHAILNAEQNRALLEQVCAAAGVELGTWDARTLYWLANFEDALCGSVAGMITRAHEADAAGAAEAKLAEVREFCGNDPRAAGSLVAADILDILNRPPA